MLKSDKSKVGRRRFDGKEENLVVQKLEEAFAWGCSDEEACLYAGISTSALYEYQHIDELFLERKQLLKLRPVLIARKSVVEGLEKNPILAYKYLLKKHESSLETYL